MPDLDFYQDNSLLGVHNSHFVPICHLRLSVFSEPLMFEERDYN
jgi:hypothetical protein